MCIFLIVMYGSLHVSQRSFNHTIENVSHIYFEETHKAPHDRTCNSIHFYLCFQNNDLAFVRQASIRPHHLAPIFFAGTPATIEYSSTSLVTTEPAPITTPSPMVTPGVIDTFIPIHTSLPTITFL